MTRQKKLKKAIRARSGKTGESYAAARRQVVEAQRKRAVARGGTVYPRPAPVAPVPTAAAAAAARAMGAARGAVSEASIVAKTGHGFDHWFAVLDGFSAAEKGHKAAARHLCDEHRVPGWHAQGITVAYERARGLRAVNQSCTGRFNVAVSKAVAASVAEVADAIGNARRRAAWLAEVDPELARALEAAFKGPKARTVTVRDAMCARLRYPWDGRAVELRITGKPQGGSTVVADNVDLPAASLVEDRRARWRTALEALRAHLSP
jgi:hypothetical protein